MKMKVLDLNSVDLNVEVWDEHELSEDGWVGYWNDMQDGCLDDIEINYDDIDRTVYVAGDGGELFRLKDGTWMNICWRFGQCRIWVEEDPETLELLKEKLG
ncbi:MAG: hypothetical protein ACI4T5_06060 [Prevotella sp.]